MLSHQSTVLSPDLSYDRGGRMLMPFDVAPSTTSTAGTRPRVYEDATAS